MPIEGTGSDANRPPDTQDNDSGSDGSTSSGADKAAADAKDSFSDAMSAQRATDKPNKNDKGENDSQAQGGVQGGLSASQVGGATKGLSTNTEVDETDIDYGELSGKPTDKPLGPHTPQTNTNNDMKAGGFMNNATAPTWSTVDPNRQATAEEKGPEVNTSVGYNASANYGTATKGKTPTTKAGPTANVNVKEGELESVIDTKLDTRVGQTHAKAGTYGCASHANVGPGVGIADTKAAGKCQLSAGSVTQKVGENTTVSVTGPTATLSGGFATNPDKVAANIDVGIDAVNVTGTVTVSAGPVTCTASGSYGVGLSGQAHAGFEVEPTSVTAGAGLGAKVGVGGKVSASCTIDTKSWSDFANSFSGKPDLSPGGALDTGALDYGTSLQSDFATDDHMA